jgi:hypothetical protein
MSLILETLVARWQILEQPFMFVSLFTIDNYLFRAFEFTLIGLKCIAQ